MDNTKWRRLKEVLKVAMMIAVAVAGSLATTYGHTPMELRVCFAVIAAGAVLGIGSSGLHKR